MRVTAGSLQKLVDVPTFRAVADGSDGRFAALTYTHKGRTSTQYPLRSGAVRYQVGVSLLKEDAQNVIYVMRQSDGEFNSFVRVHAKVAGVYLPIPDSTFRVDDVKPGGLITLAAELDGDYVYITSGTQMFLVSIPDRALEAEGPAGIRSDNMKYAIHTFTARKDHSYL